MNGNRPKLRLLSLLCFLAAFLVFTMPVLAQDTSVTGKVVDQGKAVIPGVIVTLTSITGAVRATETDPVGVYRFLQLPPGTYQIKAELQGFKTAVVDNVQLLVDTASTIDLVMEIGEISEMVTVEASAAKLNVTDATLGNAFEGIRIRQLPLESRNVANLLSLQPAVTEAGYVSGARSDQSNLTLDGIDVNEQQQGTAFETVIRVNPDSVQEFRVTTSNPDATQGRSSGGQVSLVSRTGTNEFHGALYWYHRNTVTTSNNFFNNRTGVDRPKLIRNLFGASFGGPVIRDRIFFFYNYEGRRDAKESSALRTVPLPTLGEGKVLYQNTAGGVTTLTKADMNALYPVGTNDTMLAFLTDAAKRYPANDFSEGDGLNTAGFRFNAPLPLAYNGHTATLNFNLDRQAKHILTLRYNYQHDTSASTPEWPDTPIPTTWSHPTGYAATHTWTVTPKVVNTFRFGLTRQAFSDQGDSDKNNFYVRSVFQPFGYDRTFARTTPVYNIVDDVAWVKGNHTWQFGTNIRLISNQRTSFGNSYDAYRINYYWYENSGAILVDPIPDIEGNTTPTKAAVAAVLGRVNAYNSNFNFEANGSLMPSGVGVPRNFGTEEVELYAQDTWRIRPDFTLTLGMRYSLNTPVYEKDGFQVKPTVSLNDFFELRKGYAAGGRPYDESIEIDLAGPVNSRPGFYSMDTNNFAPRIAAAWSPSFENGFLQKIFGTGQKSVFRGGFSVAYDRIGSRLAVSFDLNNTLGFSSTESLPANSFNVTDRGGVPFTGLDMDVRKMPLMPIPNKLEFPLSKPRDGATRIESTLDDALTTPRHYTWNFSVAREFGAGLTFEASYIGRQARNLLATRDIMHLNNLVDTQSGMDWYTAGGILYDEREKNTPIASITPIPYFENLFPNYRRTDPTTGQRYPNATSSIFHMASRDGWGAADYTYIQYVIDDRGIFENAFFHPQYGALTVWSTIGYSDYHAATFSVKQRLSSLNVDFNYTLSKSIDIGSGLESSSTYSGAAMIQNPLRPEDYRALSEFDMTHIFNGNVLWELPFGRGRSYLNYLNPVLDNILGGWQFTGVFRYNTGSPVDAPNDSGIWATNWNRMSYSFPIRDFKPSPTKSGENPNYAEDPTYAYQSFRNARPGESGARNIFREPSYFVMDFGLAKSFTMPYSEGHRLQVRWEVFNATNTQILNGPAYWSVDSDPHITSPGPNFGNITSIQGNPRVMQFALRYEF